MQLNLRPSPIAGRWYEGQPKALAKSIDNYLDNAKNPELKGEVMAVIAPHAGHMYSGGVAGHAFATLRGGAPELVTVVSPMHQYYPQALITSSHDAYQTPLGPIVIDRQAVEALNATLRSRLNTGLTPVSHDPEHSLEIELPFLQRALASDFKLLPIMVRSQDGSILEELGRSLADVLKDRRFILVASTDLSHFHDQQTANKLDREMLGQIEAFSPEGVLEAEKKGKGYACGHAAVATVLWACRALGAESVKVLKYATSGDVTGDHSSVVGYGAAAILKKN
jgi:AmmeMemoRadiSam system protein B